MQLVGRGLEVARRMLKGQTGPQKIFAPRLDSLSDYIRATRALSGLDHLRGLTAPQPMMEAIGPATQRTLPIRLISKGLQTITSEHRL
eukprot:7509197-Pyramimonas_sp.AAC.1